MITFGEKDNKITFFPRVSIRPSEKDKIHEMMAFYKIDSYADWFRFVNNKVCAEYEEGREKDVRFMQVARR